MVTLRRVRDARSRAVSIRMLSCTSTSLVVLPIQANTLGVECKQSPLGVYVDYCKKGQLAYQVCTDDNTPVFYPRTVAPNTGSANLEWRVSKGLGTVYSTTVVHAAKDQPPHNVALIDIDEGYRMMSRVEGIDPMQVKIGMRVKVKINQGDEKQLPYPVFTPAGDAE